jgi:hypothetical protein
MHDGNAMIRASDRPAIIGRLIHRRIEHAYTDNLAGKS